MSLEKTGNEPKCPRCGNEIDPEVCHCGDLREHHGMESGHFFVPWGCTCYYAKKDNNDRSTIQGTPTEEA